MRRSATTHAAVALIATVVFVAMGTLAFIPPTALPKARVAASLARRGVLRMDAGEEGPKLAKIEQLKVCRESCGDDEECPVCLQLDSVVVPLGGGE